MSCAELELLAVSDDAEERRLWQLHAAGCARCRQVAAGEAELARRLELWTEAAPAPPAQLRQRLLAAVADEARRRATPPFADAPRPLPPPRQLAGRLAGRWRLVPWAALAASLLVAGLLLHGLWPVAQAPAAADRLLVSQALEAAERAERSHAQAIAQLERLADPILAGAADPDLPPAEAGVLLAYRGRLASLDQAIAEIQTYLEDNPSHAGARAVLLAAYNDKTQVLRQVLAHRGPER